MKNEHLTSIENDAVKESEEGQREERGGLLLGRVLGRVRCKWDVWTRGKERREEGGESKKLRDANRPWVSI